MAKKKNSKDFSGDFSKLLGTTQKEEETKKKVGRPKDKNKRTPEKSSQEGTKNDETRATFIVKEELLEKLKDIAYWDREMIKAVVGEALSQYVDNWEKKNGKVKPRKK